MNQNPLIDVAKNIQQKKLEEELQNLTDELKTMNKRLSNIETLLQRLDKSGNQAYIQ